MGSLLNLLKGPVKETVGAITGVLDKFITDPQERLKAELELAKIEADLQSKLINADVEWAKAGAEVVKAEVNSPSILARTWRPMLMYVGIVLIAYNYLVAAMFSLPTIPMPDQLWELLKIGMGGYVVGRTVEKTAPDIIRALKK